VEKLYPDMITEQIIKREVMAETIRLQPQPNPHMELYASDLARQADDEHDARMKPRLEQFERETRARVKARRDGGEFKNNFTRKYGSLVDLQAMDEQLDTFKQTMGRAQQFADDRANDHVRWACSERLLQALDRYDPDDFISGLAFAEQTGRCVIGMELCGPGSSLLDRWWRSDPTERNNIALRSIAANQNDIKEEITILIDAAKTVPVEEPWPEVPEFIVNRAYAVAKAFGHINTLYEDLERQGKAPSAGLMNWYTALGRQVLRTAAPNSFDHALHHGLRLTFAASVHETAVIVRINEAARSGVVLNTKRTAGQVTHYLDKAWAEGLMQASNKSSDFYKVRAAGLLCLFEGLLMASKASKLSDSSSEERVQLLAAAMTTAGAGFELGASYIDQVVKRYGANSVTGRGAELVVGRLKLWGASLAGAGALVVVWLDIVDGRRHLREVQSGKASTGNSEILMTAYYTRVVSTITLAGAELGAAIAFAKPLFEHLAKSNKNPVLKYMGESLGRIAGRIGSQAARLLLSRLALGAFWVGLAVTLIIFLFDDDALEKWCKRSSYRTSGSTDTFNEKDELPALFNAFSEVS